jgi:hypothetical protein
MNSTERERRDWILLPIIVLLGILFMYLAGQRAIRMAPSWHVVADMASNLDPNAQFQEAGVAGVIEPVRAEILTPPVWAKTYLTPGANNGGSGMVAPAGPASNSPTPVAPSPTPVAPTATPVSASPTPTAVVTQAPTYVAPQPTATKKKDKPPAPTATPVPVVSTLDPTDKVPQPVAVNQGPPDGTLADAGTFPDGSYFVVDVHTNPVHVAATPDGNYDLVYYEDENPNDSGLIAMDQVKIGITNDSSGQTYYKVFDWGDGLPDTNSNVDTTKLSPPSDNNPAEVDNQTIATDDLYKDPAATPPPTNSQTGILIDVDQAPSHPPPGDYKYVVIVAPPDGTASNPSPGDGGQMDSIDVKEVPIPPAPP